MKRGTRPAWLRESIDAICGFRPYVTEGLKGTWHDQVKGFLFTLGALIPHVAAIPEYPVSSPSPRQGIARIDMVWLLHSKPLAAFEIDGGIKLRSVAKLHLLSAPWKFIVSGGESGHKMKWRGSPRLAGTDIEHLVIEPTADIDVFTGSAFSGIDQFIDCQVVFDKAYTEPELKQFA